MKTELLNSHSDGRAGSYYSRQDNPTASRSKQGGCGCSEASKQPMSASTQVAFGADYAAGSMAMPPWQLASAPPPAPAPPGRKMPMFTAAAFNQASK